MPRFDTAELGSWEQDVATLAGSFVHEVKNPLSTLNINAQLLLEEFTPASAPRELRVVKRLEVIIDEVSRIEEIVTSFVRFTQPQDLDRTRTSVNDLLAELAGRNSEALERHGIRVRFQPDDGLPDVQADGKRLYQAFVNLLGNAQHAMPDGGELILRTHLHDEHLEIEVIDTGSGIPEERLPRIFRPYVSTRAEGSGLGLPITLRIIRAHGGQLAVESEVGKGSRFIISLPLTPQTEEC